MDWLAASMGVNMCVGEYGTIAEAVGEGRER